MTGVDRLLKVQVADVDIRYRSSGGGPAKDDREALQGDRGTVGSPQCQLPEQCRQAPVRRPTVT
jgi:hypothetical protein